MRKRCGEKREFWRAVMEMQEASGLTVAAFCEQEEIKVATFYSWRRTLRLEDAEHGEREPSGGSKRGSGQCAEGQTGRRFAMINVVEDSPSLMELQSRDGAIIRLRETADDGTVRRLLAILREA